MPNCNKCRYYNKVVEYSNIKIIMCTGEGTSLEACVRDNIYRPIEEGYTWKFA